MSRQVHLLLKRRKSFKVVKDLKAIGIGIIYITHRLDEVFEISTDVGIMRDGRITLMGKIEEFTKDSL